MRNRDSAFLEIPVENLRQWLKAQDGRVVSRRTLRYTEFDILKAGA